MSSPPAAPLIYTTPFVVARSGVTARVFAGLIAAGCLAVLVTAATLSPDGAGTGTHTQLGMRPCSMRENFNIPCLSCGMTTSFSLFADGRFLDSFVNQPMGFWLALLSVVVFWGAGYVAVTGIPAYRLLNKIRPRVYLFVLLVPAALAWAWKIYRVRSGLDGF